MGDDIERLWKLMRGGDVDATLALAHASRSRGELRKVVDWIASNVDDPQRVVLARRFAEEGWRSIIAVSMKGHILPMPAIETLAYSQESPRFLVAPIPLRTRLTWTYDSAERFACDVAEHILPLARIDAVSHEVAAGAIAQAYCCIDYPSQVDRRARDRAIGDAERRSEHLSRQAQELELGGDTGAVSRAYALRAAGLALMAAASVSRGVAVMTSSWALGAALTMGAAEYEEERAWQTRHLLCAYLLEWTYR